MHAFAVGAAALMASAAGGLLVLAIIAIAAWFGLKISEKTGRQWIGWGLGGCLAGLLFITAVPVYDALESVRCRPYKDRYQDCISGNVEVEDEEWRIR